MASAVVKSNAFEEVSVTIEYSAYDVKSTEGRDAVVSKIRRVASQICGPTRYGELKSLKRIALNRTCYDEAVENAIHDLDRYTASISETDNNQSDI